MERNAEFARRAAVHAARLDWAPSPMKGVERRMLERIGDEVARATSIVRYAAGSRFSAHIHTGGEEFYVLDGVFQDEHGDFPAGTYVRNPPTSSHTPRSETGCIILVKLWQFDPDDRTHVRIDTAKMAWHEAGNGRKIMALFHDDYEDVRLEHWPADTGISLHPQGGLEVFVLDGGFIEANEEFEKDSWLRLPVGAEFTALTGSQGCRAWIKEGHLRHARAQIPAPGVA